MSTGDKGKKAEAGMELGVSGEGLASMEDEFEAGTDEPGAGADEFGLADDEFDTGEYDPEDDPDMAVEADGAGGVAGAIKRSGKSRKKLIIAIIIIAAVVAAGLYGFFRLQASMGQVSEDMPDIYMLTKTSLESKVTASGNFASTDPVSVGSNVTGGEVDKVFVEAGDRVYAGDVLARLKTSDIERSISDARSAITDASKGDRQRLEQAQRALSDAEAQYSADDKQTKTSVNNAEKAYNAAEKAKGAPPSPEEQAAIDKAKADWDAAIAAVGGGIPTPEEQAAIDNAKAIYDAALKAVKDRQKAAASKAKAEWDAMKLQRENTLRASASRVTEARATLDGLTGTDSARQQRSQLETLNENLENASIISPITGIVTRVATEAGKVVMGDMFVIEDTESLQISAAVAEYDIIKVEKGMTAHIKSNATGEQVYDGVVDYVAPIASDASGNFQVKVLVTSPVGQLKPGMTATVEIVTASKTDVFAVPIDAVVTRADGKKVVYAYEPGAGPIMTFKNSEDGGGMEPVSRIAGGGERPAGGTTRGSGPQTTSDGGVVMVSGDGPQTTSGDGPQMASGSGPVLISGGEPQTIGSGPVQVSGGEPGAADAAPFAGSQILSGPGSAGDGSSPTGGNRREIEVTTGMETDYYIEIFSDELFEGMLILSDPMGRSVRGGPGGFSMMNGPGGGQVVGVGPAERSVTYVSVD